MSDAEVFTPDEFLKRLNDNDFHRPPSMVGMAKQGATAKTISLSFLNCENWVEFPLSIIKEVRFLRNVPCKDHSHPLVEVSFAKAASDEGQALYSLLERLGGSFSPAQDISQFSAAPMLAPSIETPDLSTLMAGQVIPSAGQIVPSLGTCERFNCVSTTGQRWPCRSWNHAWYCNNCCRA